MIADPNLVRYACIAHCTTVLAEFNSADSSLQSVALQCLHQTPPHHSIFSHTIRKQTYTYVIDDPFVYFGIFEETLEKSDQVLFLSRLKEALVKIIGIKSKWAEGSFSSYCIQGEFHPIFHRLMVKSLDHIDSFHAVESPKGGNSNENHCNGEEKGGGQRGGRKKVLSIPLFGGLKKKKRFGESAGESKEMLVEDREEYFDAGEVTSRDISFKPTGGVGGSFALSDGGVRQHKAKKIWRRHVWIVLTLDLAVCLILFGVWLWVCQGFQCIIGS